MNAARTIRQARLAASLSKRELARRAGTSPAAVVAYETGRRDPSVATLDRLLAAAGARGRLTISRQGADPDLFEAARRLVEVLDLADHLPQRPAARRLAYPEFAR